MFDSSRFSSTIRQILTRLAERGGTPSLHEVLPEQAIPPNELDLVVRYLSEEALIYIVAMGKDYSDPTIRLNIRPKGIHYLESLVSSSGDRANSVAQQSDSVSEEIMELVTQTHKGQKNRELYLGQLEQRQIHLTPGSNDEKVVEQKIKQLNQAIQRDFSKSANRKSWLAIGISLLGLGAAATKLFIGFN